MRFLPTENITYKTRLKPEEINKRLSDIVESKKAFNIFSSSSTKSYEGQINDQMFDIKRIIGYRNSFLPRIKKTILRDYDGITIRVKMRLHIFVIIFLCFWFGSAGFGFIVVLTQSFNLEFDVRTLITFGMLLFVYGMAMGGFKFESYKSKKELQKLFEAEIVEE